MMYYKKFIIIFIILFLISPLIGGTFTNAQEPMGPNFGIRDSSIAYGDYDNDGDLDIALTGDDGINYRFIIFYNDNSYFYQGQEPMGPNQGVKFSSIAFGDYDNDEDLDIALTGNDGGNYRFIIFRNDNGIYYQEQEPMGANQGVSYSSIAFGDYDNDGDLDIALTGDDGSSYRFIIFRNENGIFTQILEPMGANLGVRYSSITFGDYDNDGDLDIALTGHNGGNPRFIIFRNDLTMFTNIREPMGINQGVADFPSIANGDFNNNGYLDISLTGEDGGDGRFIIFKNISGTITEDEYPMGINQGVWDSSIANGDLDNDGDIDISLTGKKGLTNKFVIFSNNGNCIFNKNQEPLGIGQGIKSSSIALGDYDNDGDLDIALTGNDGVNNRFIIFRNIESITNLIPEVPSGMSISNSNGYWRFVWNASTDDHTSTTMIRYKIALGMDKSGIYNYSSKIINFSRGHANIGNIPQGWISPSQCYYQSKIPVTKKVYWTVMALDTSFKSSGYCEELIANPLLHTRIISLEPSEGIYFLRFGSIKGETYSSLNENDKFSYTEIRIKLLINNQYWDGYQWTDATNTWLQVQGKEQWEYNCKGRNIDWRFGERHLVESRAVTLNGNKSPVCEGIEFIPVYQLSQNSFCNYPNPFNPDIEQTCIEYLLRSNEDVKLLVYSIGGRIAKDWRFSSGVEGGRAGMNRIYWDGRNNDGYKIANGVYFCYLKYSGFEEMIKILVIK